MPDIEDSKPSRENYVKRINKLKLKFAPKSPEVIQKERYKTRLQSPSTNAPYLDEYDNVESSYNKYDTINNFDSFNNYEINSDRL